MKRSLAAGVVVAATLLTGCDPGSTLKIVNGCEVPIEVETFSVIPRRDPKQVDERLRTIEPGESTSASSLDPVPDRWLRVVGSGYEERFTLPDVEDEYTTIIEGDECPPG